MENCLSLGIHAAVKRVAVTFSVCPSVYAAFEGGDGRFELSLEKRGLKK